MKQHITPEQFRALPEAQQRALAVWLLKRDGWGDDLSADRGREARVLEPLRQSPRRLTIGVLLEYLHERGQEPYVLDQKDGWRVSLASSERCSGWLAPDLIDALWAAVGAVLEREVGA